MNKDVENLNNVEEIVSKEVEASSSNNGSNESYYSSAKYPDRVRLWTKGYNERRKNKIAEHTSKVGKFFSAIGNYFLMFFVNLAVYISVVFYDFVYSIILSPTKGAMLLLFFPGIFIGFFLNIQIEANYSANASNQVSPVELFALVMISVVQIATAVSLNKTRSLKSCIMCTIVVGLLLTISALYVMFLFQNCVSIDKVLLACILIIMSDIASIAGVVIAYIFRDRTYKKEIM